MKSCWIFGGAPVSDSFRVTPPADAFIIAADSGYSLVKRMGFTPNLLLGDFDSLKEDKPAELAGCEIMTVAAEKDDTDTMLAVKTALSGGYKDITIVGGTGGRLDHTVANFQTLVYILEQGGKGRLLSENDETELVGAGEYIYPKKGNYYLSLFAYGGDAVITTTGTKYNLTDYRLTDSFPLGVSNEILSENCRLVVFSGRILVIFSKK